MTKLGTGRAPAASDPNNPRKAIGIRQPWAELILRGKKTIEVRSGQTKPRGQVYLYANLTRGADDSDCERLVGCPWDRLDRGKLIGIINITGCRLLRRTDADAAGFDIDDVVDSHFAWIVEVVKRFDKPIKPTKRPGSGFFLPF